MQIRRFLLGSSQLPAAAARVDAKTTETANKATAATENDVPHSANSENCSLPPSTQSVIKPSISKKKSSMVANRPAWFQQIFHNFNNKVDDDDRGEKSQCKCMYSAKSCTMLSNDSKNVVSTFQGCSKQI